MRRSPGLLVLLVLLVLVGVAGEAPADPCAGTAAVVVDADQPGHPCASPDGVASAASVHAWGEPTWADEFSDDVPGPQWALYKSAGHNGNGVRDPAQVSVAGGALTQSGTADGRSAGMVRHGGEARFGRWEVRARADQSGAGSRPYHLVIALIPVGIPYAAGERDIDFAETDIGTGEVNLFVHYPPYKQDYLSIPIDLAEWHTYAVEITPTHVAWFVDGVPRATVTRPEAIPTSLYALNVQLDAYRPDDLIPGRLQVDWARYHALPAGDVPPPAAPAPPQGDFNP